MRPLATVSVLALWAVHFLFVYGFTGLACARGLDRAVPWTVGLASIAAAGIAAAFAVRGARRGEDFGAWITAAVAAAAIFAIVLETIPLLLVPPCATR